MSRDIAAVGNRVMAIATVLTVGCAALAGCTPGTRAASPRSTAARASRSRRAARPAPAPADTVAPTFRGTLVTRTIPGTRSGFRARAALIYVPASVRTTKATDLPVLELLHGTPGGPGQWVDQGAARASADTFAAHHHGQAPIIVMPDINGTGHGDTECVQAARGSIEQYLTVDVPHYVLAHFPAARDRRRWSIAGNSEGGTCALVLALRHVSRYHVFGDLSGLARPTAGDHDDRQRTIDSLFGGSSYQYDQHDPLYLLSHHSYPQLAGWLARGHDEHDVAAAQTAVVAAARRAHLPVSAHTLPGAHSWAVWTAAFRDLLAWIWTRTSA